MSAEPQVFCTDHAKAGRKVPADPKTGLCSPCFRARGDAFIAPLLPEKSRKAEELSAKEKSASK